MNLSQNKVMTGGIIIFLFFSHGHIRALTGGNMTGLVVMTGTNGMLMHFATIRIVGQVGNRKGHSRKIWTSLEESITLYVKLHCGGV